MEGINQAPETKPVDSAENSVDQGIRQEHMREGQESVVQMLVDKGILDRNGEVTGRIRNFEKRDNQYL